MENHTVGPVIAERRYILSTELGPKEVIVRLGAPEQSPDDRSFFCPFEIVGLGSKKVKCGFGADAFQAIRLTLKMIGVDLHYYRQTYGLGFYFLAEGDDLGFPEEAWTDGLGHQIVRAFGPVYGLKLSIARNAGSMKNFQFGAIRPHPTGKGTIGQFALHIQCPWRLVTAQPPWLPPRTDLMVTGSGDWWEPAEHREDLDWDRWNEHRAMPSMQEKLLQALFQEYDTETKSYLNTSDRLIVEQVEADDYGGLNIHLSGGFRLQAFPNGISGEHWRLFQPGTENLHLAMRDGKLTEA
jgi:hypothetical protein